MADDERRARRCGVCCEERLEYAVVMGVVEAGEVLDGAVEAEEFEGFAGSGCRRDVRVLDAEGLEQFACSGCLLAPASGEAPVVVAGGGEIFGLGMPHEDASHAASLCEGGAPVVE